MELVTLGIFCAALVGAIFTGVPTVCALLVGLAAFCIYAWRWSGSARRVARMCWEGIAPIAKILGMLALIGVLTGLWRAAGVIPAIVYYAVPLISPGVFLLATFLLNCLVSVWTGTSFGTAATVGSICISMAGAMGVPLFAAGGAALSRAFFGDRCSPISTSALLVADLTGTDFYNNLKRMVKSAAVPFVLTCAVYFALGPLIPASGEAGDMAASLASAFAVGPVVLPPPMIVFALSVFTAIISCNQTLAIMLAHQLCSDLDQSANDHALDLEDSVVLVAGLVPWSIAGAVPLASMGAPIAASMALAIYLYAVPAWRLLSGWFAARGQVRCAVR